MDAIYYITSFLTVLGIPALIIIVIFLLFKPHLANKHPRINNPISRRRIATVGLASVVVATMSFGSVLAVTEPASVKADRLVREAAEAKSLQIQQENTKKQAAEVARKQAEEQKRREAEANKPVVKSETKVESVPFEAIEQNDNSLPAGQKKPSVVGVNGERSITYSVTYVKGKETARSETKNEITKAPVAQVTLNGTYVKPAPTPAPAPKAAAPSCPNGTYVNSAGNTVCSPYQSRGGAPAGATAQCSDGTYSYSQSRRGTCSGHGGVAQWL